jgi:ribosomal protein S4
MIIFSRSRFALAKRYARFSTHEIYLNRAKSNRIRLGYKFYQKIFRRYRSKKTLKINVRKPRIAVKRKTYFGKALEMKQKWSYLIGGSHKSKISRFVRLSYSKTFSSVAVLADRLESRLDVVLAKTSIIPQAWMVKRLIRFGYVCVDGSTVCNTSFQVRLNSHISIGVPIYFLPFFLHLFFYRSESKMIFWPYIGGFELSYRTFSLIKYARVQFSKIAYPFDFDVNYFYRLYPR